MKKFAFVILTLFAVSAFAADVPKVQAQSIEQAKVATPSKSKEPAVKNQKAPATTANAKPTTAK